MHIKIKTETQIIKKHLRQVYVCMAYQLHIPIDAEVKTEH